MESSKLNTQILEEATQWLIELNSGEPEHDARRDFDAWLRKSPEHLRAYLELLPLWEDGARLPTAENTDELIALGKAPEANVIAIGDRNAERTKARSTPRKKLAIAASLLIALSSVAAWYWLQRDLYETGIGEQRSIALEDGTTIELNARSKVRVQLTAERRDVELLEGQALFRVAKDAHRPFTVTSAATEVRAVGTQFDVNQRSTGTIVTVLEGRVAVTRAVSSGPPVANATGATPRARPEEPDRSDASLTTAAGGGGGEAPAGHGVLLSAGEQLTVTPIAIALPKQVNIAAATAWTQRRLIFDASTLAEVTEEFNRYNRRRLVLRDAALETFPITAAFSSTDPSSLVRFLESQPGIQIIITDREIEISKAQ